MDHTAENGQNIMQNSKNGSKKNKDTSSATSKETFMPTIKVNAPPDRPPSSPYMDPNTQQVIPIPHTPIPEKCLEGKNLSRFIIDKKTKPTNSTVT